jgi:hypothetical protein
MFDLILIHLIIIIILLLKLSNWESVIDFSDTSTYLSIYSGHGKGYDTFARIALQIPVLSSHMLYELREELELCDTVSYYAISHLLVSGLTESIAPNWSKFSEVENIKFIRSDETKQFLKEYIKKYEIIGKLQLDKFINE